MLDSDSTCFKRKAIVTHHIHDILQQEVIIKRGKNKE